MTGIYFHIPFCKQACHYCNFHFSTQQNLQDAMIDAMASESTLRFSSEDKSGATDVATIYFGGGTPSLINSSQLKKLLDSISLNNRIYPNAEITLEANPDDITSAALNQWEEIGINRLSIGVQSLNDRNLQWMNRAHNSAQVLKSIELVKASNIHNFSVDLIYGTPGNTSEEWKKDMIEVIELGAPHIACYALTVENGTALNRMIEVNKKENIDNDIQSEQFAYLMNLMKNSGYEHYEISNFCKPGFRSKHNSSYWKGTPYIGIGPSAHSFDGFKRSWNLSNNALYIQSIQKGTIPKEEELLTEKDLYNEFIMISLRTMEGIDINKLESNYGTKQCLEFKRQSKKYLDQKHAIISKNCFMLTDEGKLFADAIASDLFC